jgi:hypothetical protein
MINFTYTKDNGNTSERLALVISEPTDNYLMLDLSDLDAGEIDYVEQQFEAFMAERKALLSKYKLSTYVKSFKGKGISECTKL